jgi:hypothetical protein
MRLDTMALMRLLLPLLHPAGNGPARPAECPSRSHSAPMPRPTDSKPAEAVQYALRTASGCTAEAATRHIGAKCKVRNIQGHIQGHREMAKATPMSV